jgi:hypothetical protein
MKCQIFLLVNILLLILNTTNGDSLMIKSSAYMKSCASKGCQLAISMCVKKWKCQGVNPCQKCLANYQHCGCACGLDLFNDEEYFTINGTKYLQCYETIEEQVKACELNCRGYLYENGQCTLLNGLPTCTCLLFIF